MKKECILSREGLDGAPHVESYRLSFPDADCQDSVNNGLWSASRGHFFRALGPHIMLDAAFNA